MCFVGFSVVSSERCMCVLVYIQLPTFVNRQLSIEALHIILYEMQAKKGRS